MEYVGKLAASIRARIAVRTARLENEIEVLQKNQRADEFYYGLGGPYRRRENAMDNRKKEIKEMEEFVKQMHVPVIPNEVIYYSIYCKHCRKNILSEGYIAKGWHECPVCRKMICGGGVRVEMLVVEGRMV